MTEAASIDERVRKLEQSLEEYKKLVRLLQEENERLKRGLLGQKAERLPKNDAQLSLAMLGLLFGDDSSTAVEEAELEQTVAEHTRKRPVRKALPEELPRVTIEIVPPEVQSKGLDAFEVIGSDIREVLERRPASTVVVRLVYKKFIRKDRDRNAPTDVLTPTAVELPIERGLAGPGMLADTIVRRWQDHQPLNRLEGIYGREGLELARSTLCTWPVRSSASNGPSRARRERKKNRSAARKRALLSKDSSSDVTPKPTPFSTKRRSPPASHTRVISASPCSGFSTTADCPPTTIFPTVQLCC